MTFVDSISTTASSSATLVRSTAINSGIVNSAPASNAVSEGQLGIDGHRSYQPEIRESAIAQRGEPVPLTIPALVQYADLYVRPDPHEASAAVTLVQRD